MSSKLPFTFILFLIITISMIIPSTHGIKIYFFEEFPEDNNLKKVEMITWNSTLFISAKSIDDFKQYKKKVERINPRIEVAWWPILEESYWISPWSNPQELERLEKELENYQGKLIIDLEAPILNKSLFIKNFFHF